MLDVNMTIPAGFVNTPLVQVKHIQSCGFSLRVAELAAAYPQPSGSFFFKKVSWNILELFKKKQVKASGLTKSGEEKTKNSEVADPVAPVVPELFNAQCAKLKPIDFAMCWAHG